MKKRKISKGQRDLARAAYKIIDRRPLIEVGRMNATGIARMLGVSLPNLSRAYKNYYYTSLHKELEITKFAAFFTLMNDHGVGTVKEALEILDIRSASHFIKRFKKVTSDTPGEICRQVKKRREEEKKKSGVEKQLPLEKPKDT